MLDTLLDFLIKAQAGGMRSGTEKKSWVLAQMEGAGFTDATISQLVDFMIMLLKDPEVHKLFRRVEKGCVSRLFRGC